MNKKILILVAVALVAVAVVFAYKMNIFPAGESMPAGRTEEEMIVSDTENVGLPDLDAEFQPIDQDLNQL